MAQKKKKTTQAGIKKSAAKKPAAKKSVTKKPSPPKRKSNKERVSRPAKKNQFTPPPRYSSQWWRALQDETESIWNNATTAMGYEPGMVSGLTWLVFVSIPKMGFTETFPVFFPTAADCLLWFRWQVVPYAEQFEEAWDMQGFGEQLARQIDAAKPRTDAGQFLESMEKQLMELPVEEELVSITTIHEFLSQLGNVDDWRRALLSDEVSYESGRWVMPSKVWERLQEVLEPVWSGASDPINPADVYTAIDAVIDQLGGGEELDRLRYCFRLRNGQIVAMAYSWPNNEKSTYKFRLTRESLHQLASMGCTHFGFVMGDDGFVLLPIDILQTHLGVEDSKLSRGVDASRYELEVTSPPNVVLKGFGQGPDTDVSKFYQARTW